MTSPSCTRASCSLANSELRGPAAPGDHIQCLHTRCQVAVAPQKQIAVNCTVSSMWGHNLRWWWCSVRLRWRGRNLIGRRQWSLPGN